MKDGFRSTGFRCKGCGYLTSHTREKCPFCSNEFEQIDDAVEMAIRKVLTNGGEVEILHDNLQLDKAGKIGALLRY